MNPIKKLVGQTAIYGIGTILGRVLNYFLTPLYTYIFAPAVFAEYNKAYAYIAIFIIVLTYGMETALFHFSQKLDDKSKVFTTSLTSILFTSSIFLFFMYIFDVDISNFMGYPGHTDYVHWMGLIIALDCTSALPMAYLRQKNKPVTFTIITLANIIVNIGLNLFFLVYCRNLHINGEIEPGSFISKIYNHDIGVGYIFIANLLASAIKMILCIPFIIKEKYSFDFSLLKKMLIYALPLVISGLGFIINERLDVILLEKYLPLPEHQAKHEIGVYSGCYKLAILMSLFIQAYRFAAEPFFFNQLKNDDPKKTYAKVMNYFVMLCCVIFLVVNLYIDVFKHFIRNEAFWEGLKIIPIIMMANLLLGIYINLSMWYKLSGQTMFGVWFSLLGAAITIITNIIFIPKYGYMASAWVTFASYLTMCIVSYIVGQKYYKIPYNLRKIVLLILISVAIVFVSAKIPFDNNIVVFLINSVLLGFYLFVIYNVDKTVRLVTQNIYRKYVSKS